MAILQHYFCLSAFFWSNVITFNLWRDIRRPPADWSPNTNRIFPLYLCYAWGLPLSVVVACSGVEFMENRFKFKYGNSEHCGVLGDDALVYSLAVPLVMITLSNIGFFVLIVYKPHMRMRLLPSRKKNHGARSEEIVLYERSSSIMQPVDDGAINQYGSTNDNQTTQPTGANTTNNTSATSSSLETRNANPRHLYNDTRTTSTRSAIITTNLPPSQTQTSPQQEALRSIHDMLAKLVWIYAKMAILMSFAWLAGFLAILTQTYLLWVVFVVLNAMQGIFIFFSFTVSPPASDLWQKRYKVMKRKWNRRARYKKFEDHYNAQRLAAQGPSGQGDPNGQSDQATAVIVPSVAEVTV